MIQLKLKMSDNCVFVPDYISEKGEFYIKSTVVGRLKKEDKDIIIHNPNTGLNMRKTFLDLQLDSEVVPYTKFNYQEGVYSNHRLIFKPDNSNINSNPDVNTWETAILKRFHWSWFNELREVLNTEWFKELNYKCNNLERNAYTVHPARENVFKSFELDITKIKAVILAQDPYPNDNATGIAFATHKSQKPVSLQLIEKAIKADFDYDETANLDNSLSHLTNQGVLLLNSALTVRKGEPNSHAELWKPFIQKVIEVINGQTQPVVFILMGAKAQYFKKYISTFHFTLSCEHPARANYEQRAWEHEGVFRKTNEILNIFNQPIKWIIN